MNERIVYAVAVALLLAAIGVGGWYWWQQRQPLPLLPPLAPPVAQALPPLQAPAAVPPPIQHPIENVAPEAPPPLVVPAEPARADAVVQKALIELLGRDAVFAFLNTDGFARRFVATVDSLPRKQASALAWPVIPTSGRFTTTQSQGTVTLAAENAKRYAPFVQFVESVDTKAAVAMYVRLYPQLQKAYEDLGFPGRYFNDRLVEVIDHLLATPELKAPPQLVLPDFKGPVQPTRPWVLVEYEDAALEGLSAGQKTLLRTGTANEQRLKAKLAELRKQIVRTGATR